MTPAAGIVTPEAVLLEFRTAGLATRSLAKLVDLFFMAIAAGAVVAFAAIARQAGGPTASAIVLSLGLFVTVILGPALVESLSGGVTPGKSMMGLRVLTVEGGPVSFRHAFVRGVMQIIELPTGAAVFVALSNQRSQRLGDLAAGTFVISERAAVANTTPIAFFPPDGLEHYCRTIDTSTVTSEQFLLLRNFLLRVGELDQAARVSLGHRLAGPLARACAAVVPPDLPTETFLVCVASAYQLQHGGLPRPDQMVGADRP